MKFINKIVLMIFGLLWGLLSLIYYVVNEWQTGASEALLFFPGSIWKLISGMPTRSRIYPIGEAPSAGQTEVPAFVGIIMFLLLALFLGLIGFLIIRFSFIGIKKLSEKLSTVTVVSMLLGFGWGVISFEIWDAGNTTEGILILPALIASPVLEFGIETTNELGRMPFLILIGLILFTALVGAVMGLIVGVLINKGKKLVVYTRKKRGVVI